LIVTNSVPLAAAVMVAWLALAHLVSSRTPPPPLKRVLRAAGYEAETVAAADRDLKDTLGPLAYVVSGEGVHRRTWQVPMFGVCRLRAACLKPLWQQPGCTAGTHSSAESAAAVSLSLRLLQ